MNSSSPTAITAKELVRCSRSLRALYVEDDTNLRREMVRFFEPLFSLVDSAADGLEGLAKYNRHPYDIVITDVNMPGMDGIEMVRQIREINIEQKIVAISAHNEPEILVGLIQAGVNSFLLKPARRQEVFDTLYPVCRDARAQQLNMELTEALNRERETLKKQVRVLEARTHAADTKHRQLEKIGEQKALALSRELIADYFAGDRDEGKENVVFIGEDGDEINEIFTEITERLLLYVNGGSRDELVKITGLLARASTVMMRYAPFLDPLAQCFRDLSRAMEEELDGFVGLVDAMTDNVVTLFDAVCLDMERYVKRFSRESMAMGNIHHIHLPTTLSIRQIEGMIRPDAVEEGEIEFF